MLKSKILALAVLLGAAATQQAIAGPQPLVLACVLTPAEADAFVKIGYPGNAKMVEHLSIDVHARKVTVWQTNPTVTDLPGYSDKYTYPAHIAKKIVRWIIAGADKEDPAAKFSVDLTTNTYTGIDPMGQSTTMNCSPG
jgi:hypothetical protein